MTPEQAIQVIDNAVAIASMGRAQHVHSQEAIQVLVELVKAHPDKPVNGLDENKPEIQSKSTKAGAPT